MPRSDCWTPQEIARVRRLRAENPGMTWNGIQQEFFHHRTQHALARIFSDSNRGLRGSLAAEGASGGDQTVAPRDGATPSEGAASNAEPEAVSQHGVETEEQEPGSSPQSVTDAGSTLGQEGKRRASSSPAEDRSAKKVRSAEDDSSGRVASGKAAEGSGLAGNPDTENQEPASPVEQSPRSRGASEPIPSVDDGRTTQAARTVEDASSGDENVSVAEVIDLVESDVDMDSASESSDDSSVWWSQTDDESWMSDSDSSTPPPSGHLPSTSIPPTTSIMSNTHIFSFGGSAVDFAGSIISTQTMTNNIAQPDMRREIMRQLAGRPQTGVTNGGSQATQAPSSSRAQKPKKKKKKTAHSQAAVDPEVALLAMWAMIDTQIEQSKMLAAEIRKMRKLTTAILDQACHETQVKREH